MSSESIPYEVHIPAFEVVYGYPIFTGQAQPWSDSNCTAWTPRALPIAQELFPGEDIQCVEYFPSADEVSQFSLPPDYHQYLAGQSNPDNPLIIDGTYLQYRKKQILEAPKVLIARASKVDELLAEASIAHSTWC